MQKLEDKRDISEEEIIEILNTVLTEDKIKGESKKEGKNCSTLCGPVGAVPTACPLPCT